MEIITSVQNGKVKELRKCLQQKKYRQQTGRFVVEGEKMVREACQDGMEVDIIFVREDLAGDMHGLPAEKCVLATNQVLRAVSDTVTPQGMVAALRMPQADLQSAAQRENALLLLCERVADPGNLGTLIRCADAAGADGVILCGCADVYNPKTVRATMSSLYHVPAIVQQDAMQTVQWLHEQGFTSYAAALQEAQPPFAANLRGKTVLCVGNEANGLTKELIQLCRYRVKIPMPGRAESLNVSCAAAVLLYEAVRQRIFEKSEENET